ncbi:MAG: bifunctional phosphoglucose/phosphomannose isomerase [Candidatus Thorarchaeota archaeon]
MKSAKGIDTNNMRAVVEEFPSLLCLTKPVPVIMTVASQTFSSGLEGVCIAGMGGSAIAGQMIEALLAQKAQIPIITWRNYEMPRCVTKNWAVICVSYSGNTEETLSAFKTAKKVGCTLFAVTTGGAILEQSKDIPVALLPKGIQPRAALPVIFSIVLPIVEALVGVDSTDFSKLSVILNDLMKRWGDEIMSPRNLAERTKSLVPLFIGSGHLVSVAYRAKCQINENAKAVAFSAELPEANHNEIEASHMYQEHGIMPIFLRSTHESKRMSARFEATDAVYRQSDCAPVHIRLSGLSELEEALAITHYLDTLSVDAADIRGVDSVRVDKIAELKRRLAEGS